MTTKTIIAQPQPKTQYPKVHDSPALVCDRCERKLSFGEYGFSYLDRWYSDGCTCGGQYRFTSIKELYKLDGVRLCPSTHCYSMTRECPTPECWAKTCPIAEQMAEKLERDMVEVMR